MPYANHLRLYQDNYLDKFYNYEKNKYLSKFLESTILTPEHPNFIKEYQILIKKEEEQLIKRQRSSPFKSRIKYFPAKTI